MEAYVAGVSTRSVDDLVAALGAESGISRSEVSRICGGLDEVVEAFRGRRLDHVEFPYVHLDATYLNVRNNLARPASMATVVATGVAADGNREVLGCDVGDSETEGFWQQFLGSLRDRGLSGVRLAVSDARRGLAAAAGRWFQGAARRRCRVHFIRNLPALAPKSHQHMAAAAFRTIFAQPDAGAVADAWDQVAARFAKIGPLMDSAKAEVLAFAAFPRSHWQKIRSTNPLERINKEIPTIPRRGDLPQRDLRHPPRRRHPRRPSRRVAGHRSALPLRGLHEPALPRARYHRHSRTHSRQPTPRLNPKAHHLMGRPRSLSL